MKLSEFIYCFGKHLFKDLVTETVIVENWETGGDMDRRYIEFLNIYNSSKKKHPDLTAEKMKLDFEKHKKKVAGRFYDKMREELLDCIESEIPGKKLKNSAIIDIGKQLDEEKQECSINYKYLLKMREIEERIEGNEYESK